MTSLLFQPIELAGLTLPNRIVIAPMCQYSAEDGSATDWHMIHLGHLALSGAGLLILEATAVERDGRITPGDLGLYSDANEQALARVLAAVRRYSDDPGRRAARPCRAQIVQPRAVGWRAADPGGDGRLDRPVRLRRGGQAGRGTAHGARCGGWLGPGDGRLRGRRRSGPCGSGCS